MTEITKGDSAVLEIKKSAGKLEVKLGKKKSLGSRLSSLVDGKHSDR
jgi:hypothetical protein